MFRQRDFPRSIRINRHVWTIHFYRKPPMAENPGEELFGVCWPRERRIYIRQGQTPGERISTLVHELLHAVESEYKIQIPHALVNLLEGPIADCVLAFYRAQSRRKAPARRK